MWAGRKDQAQISQWTWAWSFFKFIKISELICELRLSFDLPNNSEKATVAPSAPLDISMQKIIIYYTVNIGFRNHPPSEGSRFLNPARPLKGLDIETRWLLNQGSGYSNQLVSKPSGNKNKHVVRWLQNDLTTCIFWIEDMLCFG